MDSRLERLQSAIVSAINDLTPSDLARRREGKWSVAEILEHLYRTYTGTIKGFQRCLEAGKPLAASPTWAQRVKIAFVVQLGRMPRGAEAPPQARPQGIPGEKVRADIAAQIAAMDAIIAQCESRWGTQTRLLSHPLLGPLSGSQWRKFHLVHGMHHLRQIRELTTIN